MGFLASQRVRISAALVLALGVTGLGLALLDPGGIFGDTLLNTSYDTLHRFGAERALGRSPVVIIYLDLQSYLQQNQDPARPWPRDLHARLLRRLTAASPRAVVFDIFFGSAGPAKAADEDLAAAIRDNGRVILAAEHNPKASHATGDDQVRARLISQPAVHKVFADAAAGWGVASLWVDDDLGVRRHLGPFGPGRPSTLSWAAASWLGLSATNAIPTAENGELWVRYYGPALTVPHVSYAEALDPAAVPDSFFRDRIVFIGARPIEGFINQRRDEFRNPFHSWSNKEFFIPGVEVHATQMLNLIRGDWLQRLGRRQELLLVLLCAGLFGGGLVWLRPIPAALVAAGASAAALGLALFGFSRGIWFPWLIVSAVQIPAAFASSVLFYSIEWYRARLRLEAAKRLAEARIREQAALIDKAHDAILVQDLAGKIVYANPAAERLYGWVADSLQRDGGTAELFSPDEAAAASARSAVLGQGEWNGELRLQTRAGQVVTVDSRWTLIRDETGQPTALLMISSDITEKKQLEAQFLRMQRMNTIGTLAGGMAHDLNNALAPILMGVQLLRRKSNDEEFSRLLDLMESNTHRGAEMVRQVLLFARGRGGDFEPLDLIPLVKELEKTVRETFPKNISVEAFLPADLGRVVGNPTQLHQVLLNLCVNARDAMPEGGRLSLAADNIELGPSEVASIPEGKPGQYISLLVSDTGTGIPPEVRARMFEPFFTTKVEGRGTGIGLSTVLRIVKSHGGLLRVDSQPGHGATFEVFLPRAPDVPSALLPQASSSLPCGHGELVLVADDEQSIRELVTEGLTFHGYRVLTAADGAEALRLFRQRSGEVRLLLTDSDMPVMDGSRLSRELRKLRPDLPVILASGEAPSENGSPAGDLVRVTKPFSLADLLAAIDRLLSNSGQKKTN
jgi:PAS domain S-box-containing protein